MSLSRLGIENLQNVNESFRVRTVENLQNKLREFAECQ